MVYSNSTGGEILDFLYYDESVDAVLMDCQMPEMDGFQATRHLRKREKLANADPLPVIAMTANVMQGDKEKSLAAGCDGYIPKPIDVDALPRQIERFLKIKRR